MSLDNPGSGIFAYAEYNAGKLARRRGDPTRRVAPDPPALTVKPLDEDGFEVTESNWTDTIRQRFSGIFGKQPKEQKE